VAVITPEKSLLFSVVPLPANSLLPEPAAVARVSALLLRNGSADTARSIELSAVDRAGGLLHGADLLDDCTISVSPTMRARWSSNSGRYRPAWKIAPVSTGGSPAPGPPPAATGAPRWAAPCRPAARLHERSAPGQPDAKPAPPQATAASGRMEAASVDPGGERGYGGGHSCESFCSIWSEVWIALEFSS
jgi:hypothetical protein